MRAHIITFVVLVSVFFLAADSQTICNKYSSLLGVSNLGLMNTLLNGMLASWTQPGSATVRYFNGSIPGVPSYTTNATLEARLESGLVDFIGGPTGLGCTDGTVANYSGNPNMTAVHARLFVQDYDFSVFVQKAVDVCNASGVQPADLATIYSYLNSFRGAIVAANGTYPATTPAPAPAPALSICDKYSQALNLTNLQLISTLTAGFFAKWTAPGSQVLIYFDGQQPPGSTNFVQNATAAAFLSNRLITFFALPWGLDCTDGTIGNYTGTYNMTAVHAKFMIDDSDFTAFCQDAIDVLNGAGVTVPDQNTVYNYLNSFRSAIVYNPSTSSGPTHAPTYSPTYAPTYPPAPASGGCPVTGMRTQINLNFAGMFNGLRR